METNTSEGESRSDGPRAWQAPQLTVLGSLSAQTTAQSLDVSDGVTAGSLSGSIGSTS
jgi:hypothetical protein